MRVSRSRASGRDFLRAIACSWGSPRERCQAKGSDSAQTTCTRRYSASRSWILAPADLGNPPLVGNWSKMRGSSGFWLGREFFRPTQFCLGRAESGTRQLWLDPGAHKSLDLLGNKLDVLEKSMVFASVKHPKIPLPQSVFWS